MKKFLGLFLALAAFALPIAVSAKTINTAGTPGMVEGKNIFEAKGTPIVINEVDGKTIITWEGEKTGVEVKDTTLVVGGYYNPCKTITENDICEIDLASTSIVMNSGSVGYILGGNAIDSNYSNYSKIHIGTVNVDINGGTIKEVSAISAAISLSNTSLSADYYSKIKTFYYADKVNIDISKATVTNRVYILSSYTYAKDVVVNINDNAVIKSGYYALAVGTNGLVDNYTVNIDNSKVDMIHSGMRSMVGVMNVNITGKSIVGDIYAGSYYALDEQSTESWWSKNIGYVDYGQVGKMSFNIDENVTYNNIYAGFQFVDKAKFLETYKGHEALNTYAKGIEGSENAEVIINIANAPKVVDSKLISMIDSQKSNVTVVYTTKTEDVPVIDIGKKVETPTLGIIDTIKLDKVLQETLKNNELAMEQIAQGVNVKIAVEIEEATVSNDVKTKKERAGKTKSDNAKIVNYFDVSVLLKNKETDALIAGIPTLANEIELSVMLPENLQQIADGYVRKFYIVREHEGSYELLDAKLSQDGTYLTFNTSKFSTYALAYEDVKEPAVATNPKTIDNIILYFGMGLMSLGGILILTKKYFKKEN